MTDSTLRNPQRKPALRGAVCALAIGLAAPNVHAQADDASAESPARVTTIDAAGWGTLEHRVYEADDALPDAQATHELGVAGEAPLASWAGAADQRVVAADLDGDGRDELVRDDVAAMPCGFDLWSRPAVFDAGSGAFRPVSIRPSFDDATPLSAGVARPPTTTVVSDAFSSSSGLVDPAALRDGSPSTWWWEEAAGPGVGQWVALRTPDGMPARGVRLSTDEADGPLRVLVRFADGAAVLVDADGLYREVAVNSRASCAVAIVVDTGGRDRAGFSEASLMLDVDRAEPAQRVDAWRRAVEGACMAGQPASAASLAADAVADAPPDAVTRLLATTSPCAAARLIDALRHVDRADEALRAAARGNATDAVEAAALAAAHSPADAELLVDAVVAGQRDPLWLETLVALHDALSGEAPIGPILTAALEDASLEETALQLAPAGVTSGWALPSDRPTESLLLALRIAALLPAGHLSADFDWSPLLTHENGSVARLAIAVIGRQGVQAERQTIATMAVEDPMPHIRAQAVQALDALGALALLAQTVAEDASSTVRAALAASDQGIAWAVSAPDALGAMLDAETWPEVRRAWIAGAIRADRPAVDDAVVGYLSTKAETRPDDVSAALRDWSARGTPVPHGAYALGRDRGADPATLPYALNLLPLAPGACDDVAWLGALRDAPDLPDEVRAAVEDAVARCAD